MAGVTSAVGSRRDAQGEPRDPGTHQFGSDSRAAHVDGGALDHPQPRRLLHGAAEPVPREHAGGSREGGRRSRECRRRRDQGLRRAEARALQGHRRGRAQAQAAGPCARLRPGRREERPRGRHRRAPARRLGGNAPLRRDTRQRDRGEGDAGRRDGGPPGVSLPRHGRVSREAPGSAAEGRLRTADLERGPEFVQELPGAVLLFDDRPGDALGEGLALSNGSRPTSRWAWGPIPAHR